LWLTFYMIALVRGAGGGMVVALGPARARRFKWSPFAQGDGVRQRVGGVTL
jgi:hypothetical protein